MHPMVARAFLNMQLTPNGRERIRAYEKRLPPGRYLQGFEVSRLLNLKPKPVDESMGTEMEALWVRYATTQLNASHAFEEEHPEVRPLSKAEEVHAWEDWALQNFQMTQIMGAA